MEGGGSIFFGSSLLQDRVTVNIHIIKPKDVKSGGSVFRFFHGGGWVLGDYPTHRRLVRDLVVESGVTAVFPDYTPSREARYPVAVNQAYASALLATTDQLRNLPPALIVVAK